jgi:hypothetical protein
MRFVCRACGAEQETYSTSKQGIYCNKQCRADYERKGRDYPTRYVQDGHWMLRWNAGGGRHIYQFEHRRIWEDTNGPIPDGFIIHHINHDPLDNRIENLQLMRRGDHIAHHSRKLDLYPDGPGTPTDYQREYRRRKRRKMA